MSTVPTPKPEQFTTIFIFRSNIFFLTSLFLKVEKSTVPTRRPYQLGTIFIFRSNFFFNISICEYRTGANEVSTVLTRYPDQFATIFFLSKYFLSTFQFLKVEVPSTLPTRRRPDLFRTIFILGRIFFFLISRFLNVAQERVRCLRFPAEP